jgi:hypothetical protein
MLNSHNDRANIDKSAKILSSEYEQMMNSGLSRIEVNKKEA